MSSQHLWHIEIMHVKLRESELVLLILQLDDSFSLN